MGQGTAVSVRVVQEVADHEGVDPMDLEPPLYSAVDTDALDALFRRSDREAGGRPVVEFTYRGHAVRVDGGEVRVSAGSSSVEAARSADTAAGD